MAGSTPNYSFNLPAVDGDEDIWGDLLNSNWSSADYELNALSVSIGDLDTRVGTAETDLSDLTGRVGTAETDISGLTTRVGTAETDLSDLTGRVGTAETDISGLTTDISDLQSDKAPLTGADFTDMPKVSGSPVVERGSNSDGEWVRFADGTQVCRKYQASVSVTTSPRTEGSISFEYTELPWTFPTSFIEPPFTDFNCRANTPTGGIQIYVARATSTVTASAVDFRLSAPSALGEAEFLSFIAIGKWK